MGFLADALDGVDEPTAFGVVGETVSASQWPGLCSAR